LDRERPLDRLPDLLLLISGDAEGGTDVLGGDAHVACSS
jgi:hypothetical protein